MKNHTNYKIELVAPAGSPEALDAAIGEGADAVYLGLRDFNARMRARNFSYNQFEAAVERIHAMNRKVYVTLNTVFEDWENDRIYPLLKYLSLVGPDAVIVQDLGAVRMIQENFPDLAITASTQMNVSSAKAVNLLSRYNVKRVVLSRELDLSQLQSIRNSTSSELEVFAHGALCVSYSGLCLFSSYFGGKSANRGKCTQACRRLFHSPTEKKGYFFSPSDLQLIEFVPDLIKAQINSIKLEGRMKSADYVGTVVRAYRYMIDHWEDNEEDALKVSRSILSNDLARNKTHYFFDGDQSLSHLNPLQSGEIGLSLGKIMEVKTVNGRKVGVIKTREILEPGDTIRIHQFNDKTRKSIRLNAIEPIKNGYLIPVLEYSSTDDTVYLIDRKISEVHYPHILPNNLNKYKRHPGITPAPAFRKKTVPQELKKVFPEGLYIKISQFQDLYILLAHPPVRVILTLNRKNSEMIRKNISNLPFPADRVVLYLEPFFPEENAAWLTGEIEYLSSQGFKCYIANNIGHLPILKALQATFAAGPYLYTFNRFAIDLLMDSQCYYFTTPLENNKRNLFQLIEEFHPAQFFVTVFAYPQLFQIKGDLRKIYDFNQFSDSQNSRFFLFDEDSSTVVIPETPFSIIDKIPQLKKAGLTKIIADLSYTGLNKQYYKSIMKSINTSAVIEKFSRFNWKEGFYRETKSD